MEKVSIYKYTIPFGTTNDVSQKRVENPQLSTQKPVMLKTLSSDTVTFRDKKEIYLDKLERLFPNKGIEKVYDKIIKDFGMDVAPKLKLYGDNDGVQAGGFTFSKNEISMSLEDLLDTEHKIVGIKDGKKIPIVSPSTYLPLFVSKQNAENFVKLHSQNGNLGFDELIVENTTPEEQRKLIVQKMAHEVIHAQQHMIMRQTEGIGEKEIIKAWSHIKPKNMIEQSMLDAKTNEWYKNSYWGDRPETEKTIPANSPQSIIARLWLESVRNYPRVDSPEYLKNLIEQDAYKRSASYVAKLK